MIKRFRVALGGIMIAALVTGLVIYGVGAVPGLAWNRDDKPADPLQGEQFIYGEILFIDGYQLGLEQHMDSGSVEVGDRVKVATDVKVFANRGDEEVPASYSDLQAGHVVGMVMRSDGFIRTIIFDDLDEQGQEFFVYGEILSIDGTEITIDQHMDSGSVDVGGRVTLAADVEVYANRGEAEVPASLSDLTAGHVVGMNVGRDGLVYRVFFDDFEVESPSDPTGPAGSDIFVYFEITGLDLENRLIHIEQHMDSGSVEVDSQLRLAGDVKVFLSGRDGEVPASLDDLEVGQSGGLILYGQGNLKNLVRKIIVDSPYEIEPSDPRRGEIFIYGEILKVEGRTVTIDQHMDSGSVDVGGQVTMAGDVIIRRLVDGYPVTPMEPAELEPGDIVGMIQNAEGFIRAIIVD